MTALACAEGVAVFCCLNAADLYPCASMLPYIYVRNPKPCSQLFARTLSPKNRTS